MIVATLFLDNIPTSKTFCMVSCQWSYFQTMNWWWECWCLFPVYYYFADWTKWISV